MSLEDGAKTAVNICMGVKKGEKVLIITDTVKERIGEAVFQAAVNAKAEAMLMKMLPRTRHGEEPPKPIAELMRHVDVIIAPTEYSLTHTQARKTANRADVRIATMPGITESMLSNGGMTADFREVEKTIKRVYKIIRNSKKAEIETELGTDLTMSLENREWIADDTGICHKKGAFTNLPAGELFIAPKEGTANGIIFVDAAFGKKIDKPVKIIVKNGFAKEIGDDEIKKMLDKRGKYGRNVAELGIGMNPNARIIGNVLEDEKVLGTVHVAFGDNSTFGGRVNCGIHLDGIIKNPTLKIDDKIILDKGKLVV
jgi:leucyl aminopeptidase (aminopeptidase T)